MKRAHIELRDAHLKLLREGKPVLVRLPDVELELSLSKAAQMSLHLGAVAAKLQDVINKGRP